jgi:hypothetical protein
MGQKQGVFPNFLKAGTVLGAISSDTHVEVTDKGVFRCCFLRV